MDSPKYWPNRGTHHLEGVDSRYLTTRPALFNLPLQRCRGRVMTGTHICRDHKHSPGPGVNGCRPVKKLFDLLSAHPGEH
jgi:hypothetical protein